MMTMNNRIKELRKDLGLTLEKFGERVGVTKTTISRIEKGINSVTDQMFKSICREFNVNENWLRTGEPPMYVEASTFSLDDFAKQHHVSNLELEIVKAYFELDEDIRNAVLSHFKEKFSSHTAATSETSTTSEPASASESATSSTSEPSTAAKDSIHDKTVEELEEEYKKSRLRSARKTGLSASNMEDGTEKAGNE